LFPEDVFLSPQHATLTVGENHLSLRDEASASGVFISISGQETIARDALFCAGQHLFRYLGKLQPQVPPAPRQPQVYGAPIPAGQIPYGVEEVLAGGRPGRAMVLAGPVLTIGQLHCDLSFPGDEDLAPRHCELTPAPQGAILRDLSGAFGTFVRVAPSTDRVLQTGDRFRIGQQVLQVESA
jgi:pSer/pThr/pTyr-binding forkhead associated (FHA) protein